MTKTLDFAYETTHEIKVGDDETTFTLVCKNEDLPVDLTAAKSITAKIGSRSGYLREQPISIDNLAKLPTGQFKFNFDKDTLDNFPTGSYFLEVWVTDAQGTSIYPSGNPLNFIVTANIENNSGATITTIAYDDFVEAMNKAASTIAKGDPGEGLDIKGQVTSVSALPTTANEGNGYLVNEELYVYTSGVWKDCGPIQGPQGIQGKTGTGISSTTIQYQISNSATTAPTGIWSNNIVATTITNPYLWMKATLNYTDGTTKDFYLVSQKGDKGDTGTVDNAGLTTAPAFVDLQTQVNNSAVGTNLLTNSNFASGLNHWAVNGGANLDCKVVVTTDSDGNACIHITGTGNVCGLYCSPVSFNQNQVTTGSVLAKGTGTVALVGFEARPSSNFGTISTKSYSKVGSTVQAASSTNNFCIYLNPVNGVLDAYVKFAKLELGSHATDWCPNPTEILTQSDYAKIQAAIVALGGSLK
ncbi:collagen-like protein [Lactiplantibacillus plantarum]|uniref:collagen-like protein n=1 Tax=Lactiplantibacillus plantarum TaxID=1590 RepID=UPI0022380579|nr:collagen-like protein [Lactiplantibacillus plantarum]MCW6126954.1 collagen-like protein [Lactiplantibacillus plantarum]